jgi:predicted LPLAT superfamily acyltransferase
LKVWYRHGFHNVWSLRLIVVSMRCVPRFVQPAIAAATAFLFFLLLKRERRAVAANVGRISGKQGFALMWAVGRVFYSFCDMMVSYCYVPGASDAELTAMLANPERGAAVIDRCLEAGKGLIMWTAHVGNPEFASRLLELHGRHVNVARVVEDKPAERMLRDRMSSDRLKIVDLREGARATLELLHALRRNEIVAMQGDRVYHPRHSAAIPFFGAAAEFPLGPFLLSRASGAPVLPGIVVRERWLHYRVQMGDPILSVDSGNRDGNERSGLLGAVRFLEAQLERHYDQWLNFFEFWRAGDHD